MSKVVHFEIPADDTARAKEFWAGLFGVDWQSYDGPVEYYMFSNEDQQSGGGLMPREGQNGLVIYFAVDNLDAASEKVQDIGGSVEGKSPVPGMGWFAATRRTPRATHSRCGRTTRTRRRRIRGLARRSYRSREGSNNSSSGSRRPRILPARPGRRMRARACFHGPSSPRRPRSAPPRDRADGGQSSGRSRKSRTSGG